MTSLRNNVASARRQLRAVKCGIAAVLLLVSSPQRGVTAERASKDLDVSKLPPASRAAVDFARDIQPLLADRCIKCHGAEKQKGGLRLDGKAAAMKVE